jgi:hypothetical protein
MFGCRNQDFRIPRETVRDLARQFYDLVFPVNLHNFFRDGEALFRDISRQMVRPPRELSIPRKC